MNRNKTVDAYMIKLVNPLKSEMEEVRSIILAVDPRITEEIKWNAPTFIYKGNMATFNHRAKKAVTLVFHTGSVINDATGLLQGETKLTRTAYFKDKKEVASLKPKLVKVVKGWIKAKDVEESNTK